MNEGNEFRFDLWLYNQIQKRGWSLYDLEEKSGVSEQSLSLYLHNKCLPTFRSFALLLKAFNQHIIVEDD